LPFFVTISGSAFAFIIADVAIVSRQVGFGEPPKRTSW